MLNVRIPAMRNQALIGLALFVLCVLVAWQVGGIIVSGNLRILAVAAMGFVAWIAVATTMRDWRTGFLLFFVWMQFEDLPRKYLGNSMYLFIGKDILLAAVYLSFYLGVRRGREKTFRPPFLLFLSLFFWLGTLQVFNQNSPNILYGLLGLKVYFYYVPLMFVGYALLRNDDDLRKFLTMNAVLAAVISVLGIAQAVLGQQFLNPAKLAPELERLGDLTKVTPLSQRGFYLPNSVFVSAGRFAEYLTIALILVLAGAAYLLLHTSRGRRVVLLAGALIGAATVLTGSRSAAVTAGLSAGILSVGFLWGAPWRWGQAHRLVRAIRRVVIVGALGLAALIVLFPEAAGSRLAYYRETLDPNSGAYELSYRSWDYPVGNLLYAFVRPNWQFGNGIGTASLSTQYVAKFLEQPEQQIGVESGYGDLIVEMGILAPFLWILWTGALLYYVWQVARRLRQTRFYPIAFAVFWYAFLLLYVYFFLGMQAYQNYTCNIYLWLLVGIVFRLPELAANAGAPVVVPGRGSAIFPGFPLQGDTSTL